jgi:hypothetical protein
LQLKKDSSTNATNHRIKDGGVDDGSEQLSPHGMDTNQVLRFRVWIRLSAYGESTSVIQLRNAMYSSPHFVENSGGVSGLADGWSRIGSAEVYNLDAGVKYLIGGQSQKIILDSTAEDQGINSLVATAATDDPVVGYAWVTGDSTADPVQIGLRTSAGGAFVTSTEFDPASPAGYNKTTTDLDGNTWYQYTFSNDGSPARGATGAQLRIVRLTADATAAANNRIFVDACYIQVGSDLPYAVPDGWCSSSLIENRGDVDASNVTEINYVHVGPLPGDAPALARRYMPPSSAVAPIGWTVGKITDGTGYASDFPHWLDASTELDDEGDGWADTASGTTDSTLMRSTTNGDTLTYSTLDAATVKAILMHPIRVFALAQTNRATTPEQNGIYLEYDIGPAWVQRDTANFTMTSTFELLDLGVIHMRGIVALDDPPEEDYIFALRLTAVNAATDNIDLDALLLLPAEEFAITEGIQDGTEFYFDGHHDRFLEFEDVALTKMYIKPILGTMYRVAPGDLMTRAIWQFTEANSATWDITSTATIELSVKPRTRHLLGTL